MAAKKKRTRRAFPPAFKRQVVARIRAGKESGKETVAAISKDIKVSENVLHEWLKADKPAKKKARRSKRVARATNGRLHYFQGVTAQLPTGVPVATIDTALAQVEQALNTLTQVRDAYRRVFGG